MCFIKTKFSFFICILIIAIIISCFKKNNEAKKDNKNKAVYVDKDGITRIDPLKIKVGDVINGWKVVRIDIKKFKDPENDKGTYYFKNKKEDRKDFSAEIEFEGNFQFNGKYKINEKEYNDYFIVVRIPDDQDDLSFPRLNYEKTAGSLLIKLRVENYNDVYQKLKAKKYLVGTEGRATFIIDKYIIDHVDGKYYTYGSIHVIEAKYVKVEDIEDTSGN